jgi:hypothetical protein
MDSSAVCRDVFDKMRKQYSRGEGNVKARQQASGDGTGRGHEENRQKYPHRVTKYNIDDCDSPGVEWQ